jgi:N-methylhydantoinase A/oxoprolinase/acetone carboxylase beta subunit
MLPSARLEEEYVVQRCGLTPTDILHTRGEMALWDSEAADTLLRIVAGRANMAPDEFGEEVFRRITDRLLSELIRKQLELSRSDDEAADECPLCDAVMENILKGGTSRFKINAEFKYPILGLGAPVGFFSREIPGKVDAEILIPPNADVANAVGAITSFISVAKRVHVVPTLEGGFAVQGLPEAKRFEEFDAAHTYAVEALEAEVIKLAEEAGTSQRTVHMHVDDRMTTIADGSELFLERILTASITGLPDRTVAE